MIQHRGPRTIELLPLSLLATALVVLCPLAIALGLRGSGAITSAALSACVAGLASLLLYRSAVRAWEARRRAGDVLFGDLMIWGWAHRLLAERRLDDAIATLGLHRELDDDADPATITAERHARLLRRIASDLETGDPYTHGHSRRVARFSASIAEKMGLDVAEVARVRTAAAVHDVGKLRLPPGVLNKPGRLSKEEFELVQRHSAWSAELSEGLEDDLLTAYVRSHHERLDGSGYPDHLAGPEVPIGARILAVADTFDAITSTRSYRSARTHHQALTVLQQEAGTKLDAEAVRAFRSVYRSRRPLAAWLAISSVVDQLVSALVGGTASAASPALVLIAATAALGSSATAVPAIVHHTAAASASVRSDGGSAPTTTEPTLPLLTAVLGDWGAGTATGARPHTAHRARRSHGAARSRSARARPRIRIATGATSPIIATARDRGRKAARTGVGARSTPAAGHGGAAAPGATSGTRRHARGTKGTRPARRSVHSRPPRSAPASGSSRQGSNPQISPAQPPGTTKAVPPTSHR